MSGNLSPFEYFVCGGFGGICTVLVGHPLDTVKVRLQTMASPGVGGAVSAPLYNGTFDCISKIVRNEGVRGLYKGMAAPLTGVSPIFAISFMGYGVGKKLFNAEATEAPLLRVFVAGAFSGIFTTVIMAPGERIKCLLQIQQGASPAQRQYNGMLDCAKKLYAQGGIRSLYRGTIATLLRDVPASGLYFATYQGICAAAARSNNGEKPSVLVTVFAGGMAGIANWIVGMPADVLKSRLQTAPEGTYPNGLRDVFVQLMRHEGPLALYKGITPVMLRAFPANAACFVGFEACASAFRRMRHANTTD